MRSSNGGWHGLAGRGFPGLPETSVWFRADDGANSLSHAGSSLIAANLCLAELRSVPEISGAEGFSLFLGERAGWTICARDGGPFQADQARRTARRRRRVPAALTPLRAGKTRGASNCANLSASNGKGECRWPKRSRHCGPRSGPPHRKNRRRAKTPPARPNPHREKPLRPKVATPKVVRL